MRTHRQLTEEHKRLISQSMKRYWEQIPNQPIQNSDEPRTKEEIHEHICKCGCSGCTLCALGQCKCNKRSKRAVNRLQT